MFFSFDGKISDTQKTFCATSGLDTGNSVLCLQILLSSVCHSLQTLAISDMKCCALICIDRS